MGRLIILAIAAFATTAICSIYYHNGSYDMGFHYAVVTHYFDHSYCVQLDIMCYYPSGPHLIAAVLGKVVHSPFLGMIGLCVFSIFAIYTSLFLIAWPNVLAIAAVCIAAVINHYYELPLVANEVRGNFFFGQLVGTAAMFVYIAALPKMKSAPTAVVSVIAVFVMMWIYPMSAVQLGGSMIILLIASGAPILHTGLFTVATAAAIYFHPLFNVSVYIAKNNGAISTAGHVPASWTVPLAFALGGITLYLAYARRAPYKFIALAAGVAGAALAQWLALTVLHTGSAYMVTKHMFGVFTVLVAAVGMAIPIRISMPAFLSTLGPAIAAAFSVVAIMPPIPNGFPTLLMVHAETDPLIVPQSPIDRMVLDVGQHDLPLGLAIKKYGLAP